MTSGSGFKTSFLKVKTMNSTAAKVQNLSDKVFQILKNKGFSKVFNDIDFNYFKIQSADKQFPDEWIAEQFIFWNSHELSDFADYEF